MSLKRAWELLQRCFQGNKKAESALTIFEDESDKPDSQERVAQQIVAMFQHDEGAQEELRALVEALHQIQPQQPLQSRAHTQSITGNAHLGVAVAGDARDILAPSVESGASGVNIANTITIIYQQAPPTVVADHEKMLRDYLTYLQRTYQSISLRGIGDDVLALPLSEVYISLTLSEPPAAALFNRELMRRITGLFKSEAPGDDERLERGDVFEWSELMRRNRRIVVVGAPGSGKSTAIHPHSPSEGDLTRQVDWMSRPERAPQPGDDLGDSGDRHDRCDHPGLEHLRELDPGNPDRFFWFSALFKALGVGMVVPNHQLLHLPSIVVRAAFGFLFTTRRGKETRSM